MSSPQNRRQMMQPWPLCLVSFGKSKDRGILPKQYSRVPTIARSSGTTSTLAQECASNTTLLTNVSPFNSQVALIADKRSAAHQPEATSSHEAEPAIQSLDRDQSPEARTSGQQQHYYAENLRNNHHRTLHGSQIYDPLLKDREVDYKQINPLLSKDLPSSDVKELMESQDFKKPEGVVRLSIPQFDSDKIPRKKRYLFQVLAAFSVSLGSLVVGFTTSYTSPAMASMKNSTDSPFEVTEEIVSWIGSIMPLSALFGGIAGGPLIEYLGRRNTILFTSIPFFFSWILIGFTNHIAMMLAGRALSGFCVGIASLSLPVYLGETIQPEVRGSLGLLPTALGNIGILVCFTVGMYLNWWQLALFGAALPVPFGLLMILIPETPRWYISKGKTKRARESLQWLRGRDTDVSDELTCIEKIHVESERQATQGAILDLFRGNNFKPLLISLGLMFFQQMSGINAVIFYTVQIFADAGSTIDSNLSTIIVGIVNFGSTFVASGLIDRLGRKILLYMSSVSMIVSLFVLGGFFYVKEFHLLDIQWLGWLPLTSFVVYVIGFSLGFGPIPWLMMGEILPAKIRGSAASIATGFNWSCTFIVTKTFTMLSHSLGQYGAFWLFGFVCVMGLFFVILFVPETSGKSLEEIERGLTGPIRRTSAVANLKPTPMAC